jgi:DNA-binding response OmpR family regulator
MEGLKVFTAEDGEDGISQAKKKHPNIILLDTLLSKLDGFSVLENLKNDPKTKNIPVILLTNLGQKDEVEKGFKLGAVDYLIKAHFKPSEIITKIKKILNLN